MNFFEHQEAARRHTALLVFYFVLAVVLIVAVIYAAAAILMFVVSGELQGGGQPRVFDPSVLWQPDVLLAVAGGTALLVAGGTTVKLIALRGGGKKVAESLGGRLVSHDTQDSRERRLVNVIEEMAIASGINVPAIYVMDGESSINAFAAGLAPNEAAIAVTRGTLERLDRDELQGVIAHEFSHIFNSDMRLNLRLIGVLNGILWIGIAGRVMLEGFLRAGGSGRRRSSSDSKGGGGGAVILAIIAFAVVLLLVGYIGLFFGKLIKSAVSRQREFLADASAVQFTRNPAGIAGALKKIGGLSTGSRIRSGRAEEASHMFFGNALGRQMLASMATHPPIAERVRRIEPTWDGSFPSAVAEPSAPTSPAAPPGMAASAAAAVQIAHAHEAGQVAGIAGSTGVGERAARPAAPAAPRNVHVDPARVVATVGTVSPDQLRYGEELLAALPEALKRAAHDPVSAPSVVMALLLDREDASVRARQLETLARIVDVTTRSEIERLAGVAREMDVHARLPLVQIAGPALARLSPEQAGELRKRVRVLVDADQRVDLFEYAMLKMLSPTLADRSGRDRKGPLSFYSLKPLLEDIEVLLSALARHGHADDASALGAFQAGAARVRGHSLALRVAEACDLDAVDTALDRLAGAVPAIRARAMEACAYTVAADGEVALEEAELLRAVGAALSCPLPPFLAAA